MLMDECLRPNAMTDSGRKHHHNKQPIISKEGTDGFQGLKEKQV